MASFNDLPSLRMQQLGHCRQGCPVLCAHIGLEDTRPSHPGQVNTFLLSLFISALPPINRTEVSPLQSQEQEVGIRHTCLPTPHCHLLRTLGRQGASLGLHSSVYTMGITSFPEVVGRREIIHMRTKQCLTCIQSLPTIAIPIQAPRLALCRWVMASLRSCHFFL